MRFALLIATVLALAAPRLADAQVTAPADAQNPAKAYYTCTVAHSPVRVGAPVIMSFTPVGGPWPSGVIFAPVATGLQGTFCPVSAMGVGTAPLLFVFIPSATGDGEVSATNSMGLIEATPPKLAIQPACLAIRQAMGGIPA